MISPLQQLMVSDPRFIVRVSQNAAPQKPSLGPTSPSSAVVAVRPVAKDAVAISPRARELSDGVPEVEVIKGSQSPSAVPAPARLFPALEPAAPPSAARASTAALAVTGTRVDNQIVTTPRPNPLYVARYVQRSPSQTSRHFDKVV